MNRTTFPMTLILFWVCVPRPAVCCSSCPVSWSSWCQAKSYLTAQRTNSHELWWAWVLLTLFMVITTPTQSSMTRFAKGGKAIRTIVGEFFYLFFFSPFCIKNKYSTGNILEPVELSLIGCQCDKNDWLWFCFLRKQSWSLIHSYKDVYQLGLMLCFFYVLFFISPKQLRCWLTGPCIWNMPAGGRA